MATIIEIRIPVEEFALAETIENASELRIEIEQLVAQNSESAMPFVWATTDDHAAFERALSGDPSVEEFSALAETGEDRLYQLRWATGVEHVLYLILKKGGGIRNASIHTNDDAWTVQLLCPARDMSSEIYEFCEDNDLSLTVDAIYDLDGNRGSGHGLTKRQYESLLEADEMGYYDVPRHITLSELAERLDVSHQALSERLRRGHGALVDRHLNSTGPLRLEEPHNR
ncbi:helix-turn-helix domain-containing protein [Halalkalicoccus tibetensis]|uniref:Helix-turn-helix domain-containing protein n=1 Tax=Halalkalicoccus tibetensis TaxID=175632 RepID=A0ABD5V4Q3_9EURY